MKNSFKRVLSRSAAHCLIASAVAMAASYGVHRPALAWGIPVADSGNFIKNTITSIESTLNTANNYISMLENIKQTTRLVTSFDAAMVFLNSEEKQALMSFIETGQSVHGALRKTEQVYDNLNRVFTTSPYKNFDDFLNNFAMRRQHGDQLAKSLYDSAKLAEDELKKAHEKHSKVVGEMPMITGVTDAAITTAQSVGVLIQQTQGIVQMMAADTRVRGQELQRQYAERAQQEEAEAKAIEALNEGIRRDLQKLRSN